MRKINKHARVDKATNLFTEQFLLHSYQEKTELVMIFGYIF